MFHPTSFRPVVQRSFVVLCWLAGGAAGTLVASDALQAMPRPADPRTATPRAVSGQVAAGNLLLTPDDTYLNLDGANYSRSETLATYTWPDNKVANAIVMKFDLSAIPAGSVITGAALHLALIEADSSPDATYTVSVHKILNGNAVIGTATGLTRDGALPWTPNICCFNTIPLAQSDISPAFDRPSINKTPGFKSWTITSMVQQWLSDPSSNFGLLLNSDTTRLKDRFRYFASADNPDSGQRPYLAISYEAGSPTGDNTRPKVLITSPVAGAPVSGSVSITATASDNVGVAGVRFLLDGVVAIGAEDASAPFAVTWNTAGVAPGAHFLTAVARDAAGNTRTSSKVSVKVVGSAADTTAPTVAMAEPVGGATLSGNVNVTANATDNVGVASVQFQCDGNDLGSPVTSAPFTLVWGTTTAVNGSHTLRAIARDVAGNSRTSAAVTVSVNNVVLPPPPPPPPPPPTGGGPVFASNWNSALGNAVAAVGDGGRWPNVWEFNGGSNVQLMSVVSGGPNGNNALRVQQRGSSYAANVQIDNAVPQSTDFYFRYYMRNDDTSNAGDHIVTADTYQYANLTYMRKMGGPNGWNFVMSLYGCGYTYPIGHWGPAMTMQNGAWYRFEYFVDFVDANHIQVHPRVYDASGTLILSDAQFRQSDFGGASWNGRSDWTLASYYAAGHSFCVDPQWVNDFGLGNNGQYAAADSGMYWYFAGVEIRTDGWPGPMGGASTGPSSLSSQYPGDAGIESDPTVLVAEKFDDASISAVLARWPDVKNGATMTLTPDVPSGSPAGSRSLSIPWAGGGANTGGHLYRQIPAVDDTLYVRYYIKYPAAGDPVHEGVWVGGSNPGLDWPDPQAGVRPTGSDRCSAAVEASGSTLRVDHYDYWMNMRPDGTGTYWGNSLLNVAGVTVARDQWVCVEQMVKLNNPVSASNGEHAIWINGVKVSHLGQGFPNGTWSGGNFTQIGTGTPFEGFRWRSDTNLRLNWIWLQNYAPNEPAGFTATLKFDHLVVATRYIGCLAPVPLG